MNCNNTPAGKVCEADLDARIHDWHTHYLHRVTVCRADACQQGDKPCPCPDACQVSTADAKDEATFWLVTAAASLGFVALIAWGLS